MTAYSADQIQVTRAGKASKWLKDVMSRLSILFALLFALSLAPLLFNTDLILKLWNARKPLIRPSEITVNLSFGDQGFLFPDLVKATQVQVNFELQNLYPKNDISIKLIDNLLHSTSEKNHNLSARVFPKVNYSLELILSKENSIAIDTIESKALLFYDLASIHSNDLPFLITQTLLQHLVIAELENVNTR